MTESPRRMSSHPAHNMLDRLFWPAVAFLAGGFVGFAGGCLAILRAWRHLHLILALLVLITATSRAQTADFPKSYFDYGTPCDASLVPGVGLIEVIVGTAVVAGLGYGAYRVYVYCTNSFQKISVGRTNLINQLTNAIVEGAILLQAQASRPAGAMGTWTFCTSTNLTTWEPIASFPDMTPGTVRMASAIVPASTLRVFRWEVR